MTPIRLSLCPIAWSWIWKQVGVFLSNYSSMLSRLTPILDLKVGCQHTIREIDGRLRFQSEVCLA